MSIGPHQDGAGVFDPVEFRKCVRLRHKVAHWPDLIDPKTQGTLRPNALGSFLPRITIRTGEDYEIPFKQVNRRETVRASTSPEVRRPVSRPRRRSIFGNRV